MDEIIAKSQIVGRFQSILTKGVLDSEGVTLNRDAFLAMEALAKAMVQSEIEKFTSMRDVLRDFQPMVAAVDDNKAGEVSVALATADRIVTALKDLEDVAGGILFNTSNSVFALEEFNLRAEAWDNKASAVKVELDEFKKHSTFSEILRAADAISDHAGFLTGPVGIFANKAKNKILLEIADKFEKVTDVIALFDFPSVAERTFYTTELLDQFQEETGISVIDVTRGKFLGSQIDSIAYLTLGADAGSENFDDRNINSWSRTTEVIIAANNSNNTVRLFETLSIATVLLEDGDDVLEVGKDVQFVKPFSLIVDASDGKDEITIFSAGDAKIFGRSGEDTFKFSSQLFAELDGGDDNDTLDFKESDSGILLIYADGEAVDAGSASAREGASMGEIEFTSIEKIILSERDDVVIGNEANNIVSALGGNDVLIGGKGADSFEGGLGNQPIADAPQICASC